MLPVLQNGRVQSHIQREYFHVVLLILYWVCFEMSGIWKEAVVKVVFKLQQCSYA
jgi:hypothetical protein